MKSVLQVDERVFVAVCKHALSNNRKEEVVGLLWRNRDGLIIDSTPLENLHVRPEIGATISKVVVDRLRDEKSPDASLAGCYHSHVDEGGALSWRDYFLVRELGCVWIIAVAGSGTCSVSAYHVNKKNCVAYIDLERMAARDE